jgi:hypothetical protein
MTLPARTTTPPPLHVGPLHLQRGRGSHRHAHAWIPPPRARLTSSSPAWTPTRVRLTSSLPTSFPATLPSDFELFRHRGHVQQYPSPCPAALLTLGYSGLGLPGYPTCTCNSSIVAAVGAAQRARPAASPWLASPCSSTSELGERSRFNLCICARIDHVRNIRSYLKTLG